MKSTRAPIIMGLVILAGIFGSPELTPTRAQEATPTVTCTFAKIWDFSHQHNSRDSRITDDEAIAKVDSVAIELTGNGAQRDITAPSHAPASAVPAGSTPGPVARAQSVRPRVFIASSTEGLAIAEAIELDLQYFADVTIWDQGVFDLSACSLAALDEAADQSDFAIVVLTPDDVTTKRGQTYAVPRDNVIFELGFFMGRLGPERTYIVYSRTSSPALPSDIAGVTAATFAERPDGNLAAAVGPASTQIKNAMEVELAAEATEDQLAPTS